MASRQCSDAELPKLRDLARGIKAVPGHDRSIDQRLSALIKQRWCRT
jgi:hypothetical protein